MRVFKDRADAGRELGHALREFARKKNTVVIALPRGGVPVGYELSRTLELPLDVLIVRKLGAPGQSELAMGAIASNGVLALNPNLERLYDNFDTLIEDAIARELPEVERRERRYRGKRPSLSVQRQTVIVVDDGAATGSTMQAAVRALRKLGAKEIIVALPVAPEDCCNELDAEADRVICLEIPESFVAVGQWYQNFPQLSDEEVIAFLARPQDRAINERSHHS